MIELARVSMKSFTRPDPLAQQKSEFTPYTNRVEIPSST
jgi:hypothetical protein